MGLFDMLRRKSDKKAIFLGLDNSGKSTIISFLQEGHFVPHTPTMGKKKVEIDVVGTRISLFDMGGQEDFRNMWLGELKNAKVVVFVIDGVDKNRFGEARAELKKIIPSVKTGASLLVLVNKWDILACATVGDVIEAFGLLDLDNFEIMDISARTGYNIANAFAKFYTLLTGQQVRRNKLASAISVYDYGGTPIVSHLDDMQNVERKAIEGGFLVAITQFCNMKLSTGDDMGIIAFESKNNGTFLVAKTAHYIGSILWQGDLGVSIEQSKVALTDLLDHLESTCECKNTHEIEYMIEHYITNLM